MIGRDDVRKLIGLRVRLKHSGTVESGLLRALTPKDVVILAGVGGIETLIPLEDVKGMEDARYACTECGERVNRIYGAGRCSMCYSDWCVTQPPPSESCEECGKSGAVYSPGLKFWLCSECRQGYLGAVTSSVEVAALNAVCRSADRNSPLHDWKVMRSQSVCRRCRVKVLGHP